MEEIWKDIVFLRKKELIDYRGKYEVSDLGNVRRIGSTKTLKPSKSHNGYLHVSLCDNNTVRTFNIHKLVAYLFLKNINKHECVNHINGDKKDNRVCNLEWCSCSENMQHASKNNLLKAKENKINQYDLKGNFIKEWFNATIIEKELNIDHSNIIKCCKGKRKQCKGFIFKYSKDQEQ